MYHCYAVMLLLELTVSQKIIAVAMPPNFGGGLSIILLCPRIGICLSGYDVPCELLIFLSLVDNSIAS